MLCCEEYNNNIIVMHLILTHTLFLIIFIGNIFTMISIIISIIVN